LLVPQRFYVTQQSAFGDRHLYGSLSRFVPPTLHALFEHVAPASPSRTGVPQDAASTIGAVDLGARVRSLWA
jgi:DNA helicase-2/ATP-dependent DNA helicase PcrA